MIACSRKSFGMLLILGLFLLALSCVPAKNVKYGEDKISLAAHGAEDKSPAVEIKPKIPQTVNIPDKGPLQITVKDAILIALENNRSLVVERLNPSIEQTFEDQERAMFDSTVEAEVSTQRNDTQRLARSGSDTESSISDVYQGSISLREFFPTGTFVEADAVTETTDSTLYNEMFMIRSNQQVSFSTHQ